MNLVDLGRILDQHTGTQGLEILRPKSLVHGDYSGAGLLMKGEDRVGRQVDTLTRNVFVQ